MRRPAANSRLLGDDDEQADDRADNDQRRHDRCEDELREHLAMHSGQNFVVGLTDGPGHGGIDLAFLWVQWGTGVNFFQALRR